MTIWNRLTIHLRLLSALHAQACSSKSASHSVRVALVLSDETTLNNSCAGSIFTKRDFGHDFALALYSAAADAGAGAVYLYDILCCTTFPFIGGLLANRSGGRRRRGSGSDR